MRWKQPYWPDNLMKRHIKPVAKANGIHKKIGWHTFRHSFGTFHASGELEQASRTEQGCKDDGLERGNQSDGRGHN
jgi:hypothetical protein